MPRPNDPKARQGGFSLIEVLVSLVLSGILMGMIGMVMRQVVGNSETLQATVGQTSAAATLRRLLHRDLTGGDGRIMVTPTGFTLTTGHNHLLAAPLPMTVEWVFRGSALYRREILADLQYGSEMQIVRGLAEWQLDVYDLNRGGWVNIRNHSGQGQVSGLRLILALADKSIIKIAERIPYATSF